MSHNRQLNHTKIHSIAKQARFGIIVITALNNPKGDQIWKSEIKSSSCGSAAPDIELLPALSAYFGVTIDELFALSDDTRMERIQNMIWDVRYLNPAEVENERQFLLEKAAREPNNGRPHELLADLENHLAGEHREKAAEYAKEALRRNPDLREAHSSLVEAMNGKCSDWCVANHHALINYYEEFVAAHPDNFRGYLWLMDQLLDDNRLAEAWKYWETFSHIDNTYRTPLYEGKLLWRAGDKAAAMEVWCGMQQRFPDEWCVWLSMGDLMAQTADYEEAKRFYRKALDTMAPPRFVDGLESIAQVCELQGDIPGAIAALEEELMVFAKEWNFTSGETADVVHREIARLKMKMA